MSLVEYKAPYEMETSNQITLGNYIAFKCSGWYNGGKVSWNVIRVNWITGTFERHSNKECMIGNAIAEQLGLLDSDDASISVHGGGIGDIEYCYVTENDFGHMTKREARKLMASGHADHDNQTITFINSLNSTTGIEKIIR